MGRTFILGGGMTGLATGCASGLPVYEATGHPGGICCSYYMRPGSNVRLNEPPADGEAYRFEIGGGHWIFGGEPAVLEFINRLCATRTYFRKSSVFLPDKDLYVPYPLQNHLRLLRTASLQMSDGAIPSSFARAPVAATFRAPPARLSRDRGARFDGGNRRSGASVDE